MRDHLTIEFKLRDVYGKTLAYPANEQAKALASIAGQTTLTPAVLRTARDKLSATLSATGTTPEAVIGFINGH